MAKRQVVLNKEVSKDYTSFVIRRASHPKSLRVFAAKNKPIGTPPIYTVSSALLYRDNALNDCASPDEFELNLIDYRDSFERAELLAYTYASSLATIFATTEEAELIDNTSKAKRDNLEAKTQNSQ